MYKKKIRYKVCINFEDEFHKNPTFLFQTPTKKKSSRYQVSSIWIGDDGRMTLTWFGFSWRLKLSELANGRTEVALNVQQTENQSKAI